MTTLNFQTFKHGPSFYKLNTSLLNDLNYVDMINKYLDEADRKFQDLDPHVKWEMLKIEIAEISQEFSKGKNPQRIIETDVKQQQLNELEQSFSKDPKNQEHIDRINKLKHELEIRCMEETKGAQLRAGIKWIEEGERGTQFFLNLEKIRSKNNTIYSIKKSSGYKFNNHLEVLVEICKFYEKLYSGNMSNADVDHLSETFTWSIEIPKVKQEDKEMCDSPIR
ncbi:reverse transcriptase [Elysia marginata]|uniref:Reverse transcriptase n=1 Tax=Elysia marginata TaxID=1093978 RepID=A0AAV4IDU9_9GAST|nr:reverse transcriptase [Elysia marginata]